MPAISFQCFQILEEEVHNDPGVTGGFIARSAALFDISRRPSVTYRVSACQRDRV
jgi:hypothetical protein